MDSPEPDRIKAPPSSFSPTPTESPLFDFLSNLSPIQSVKAARYTQRFSETHFPTPPPVFRTPRLDLQRETSFLKSDKTDEAGSDVHGQCGNRPNAILIRCLEKEVLSCSPSGGVEEYLTDPVEVEDSTNSADSQVQQANNNSNRLSQFSFAVSKETIPKVNDANDGNSEDCMLMLPDQANADLPLGSLDLLETAVDQRDAENLDGLLELTSKIVNDQVEPNLLVVSRTQHYEQDAAQSEGDLLNQHSSSCQLSKSFQGVESYKDSLESSGLASEGSSKQHGTRRHLQFGAAMTCRSNATFNGHSPHNVTDGADNSNLTDCLSDLESLIASHDEPGGVSNHRQAMSSDKTIASWTTFGPSEFIISTQHSGNLAISGSIPSGTGLHSSNISREVHANVDNNQQDDQGIEEISSDVFRSTDSKKLPCNYLHGTLSEQEAGQSEGRMLTSEAIDRAEELNQLSHKKKKKRATMSSESEGCKRCNCRRSKCLKLYCECFAAGVYCVDSCACESCYNKPEYEDTVLDTRQQIESRNPLAFAPKIVKQATDSPANVLEDGNWATPASARHKRGCNCKKSKCLKKYCECFQAKVGCSDACRCEGCNNSFGKKAESMYQRAERWKNPSHCKVGTTETDTDRTKAGAVPRWEESADISHLSPLSHSYSGVVAPSVSPTTRDCPNVSPAQLHPVSSLKSSDTQLRWCYSPMSLTPLLFESMDAHELSSENALTEKRKDDDDMPEILKNTSTPTKAINTSSPNKKRVSPPQVSSQELPSTSSPGLQSGRKFVWQTVPSFPPLTPYSKSKEGITQTESDIKHNTSDH